MKPSLASIVIAIWRIHFAAARLLVRCPDDDCNDNRRQLRRRLGRVDQTRLVIEPANAFWHRAGSEKPRARVYRDRAHLATRQAVLHAIWTWGERVTAVSPC